jgi:hypothetical protein
VQQEYRLAVLQTNENVEAIYAERRFINWRSFSLTLFFIFRVSLLRQGILAVLYRWWDYQSEQISLCGLEPGPGSRSRPSVSGLRVTYTTAIVFEIVELWQASENFAIHASFGLRNSPVRSKNK